MKIKLSVIIVTHNTKELLKPLMESLFLALDNYKNNSEIIIIDNDSSDQTVDYLKSISTKIVLIESKENKGYAWANNQGLKIAKGEYLLLLNSDTILYKDTLKVMISYLDSNSSIGATTCKLVLKNGDVDLACHRGFPTPWAALTYFLGFEKIFPKIPIFSSYHLLSRSLNSIHEIDSPSGAFFLFRKKIIDQIGLLDEDFFMYGEDLDFAYRIKEKGWKITYNPLAQAIHLKKQSGIFNKDKKIRKKTLEAFYDAMKIFYRKHYFTKYPKLFKKLIFLFIDIKKQIALNNVVS